MSSKDILKAISKSKNAVFVIVMADGCGACSNFKATSLNNLKKALKTLSPKIILEVVEFSSLSVSEAPKNSHPDLLKFIRYFPSFFMFTVETWSNKKSSNLDGVMLKMEEISGAKGIGDIDRVKESILNKMLSPPFNGDIPKEIKPKKEETNPQNKERETKEDRDNPKMMRIETIGGELEFNIESILSPEGEIVRHKISL